MDSGKRWGFFPSVSAGWRVTEENFFKSNEKLNFINNLKLRASYGTLGNDGGDDVAYYQYLNKFITQTDKKSRQMPCSVQVPPVFFRVSTLEFDITWENNDNRRCRFRFRLNGTVC